MTAAEWAVKNGIIGRAWEPRFDQYVFDLNTGHRLAVSGSEFDMALRLAPSTYDAENQIAMIVRAKWFDLQRQHFESAHARGGYS